MGKADIKSVKRIYREIVEELEAEIDRLKNRILQLEAKKEKKAKVPKEPKSKVMNEKDRKAAALAKAKESARNMLAEIKKRREEKK
jgi:hypothetical protein